MTTMRGGLIWLAVALAVTIPLVLATVSPLLQWRGPIYIIAGFAGILALGLMLVQPMLISVGMPGLSPMQERRVHRWVGAIIVLAIAVHIGGLWYYSAPDVIDALTFASPTPFSVWGVIAMWAVIATALLAVIRRPIKMRPRTWRWLHTFLAVIIVVGTVVHAVLIEGTMEFVSKVALCGLVILATTRIVYDLARTVASRPGR